MKKYEQEIIMRNILSLKSYGIPDERLFKLCTKIQQECADRAEELRFKGLKIRWL